MFSLKETEETERCYLLVREPKCQELRQKGGQPRVNLRGGMDIKRNIKKLTVCKHSGSIPATHWELDLLEGWVKFSEDFF